MHQLRCTHDVRSVHVTDRLVTEAHTEQWRPDRGEHLDRLADDAARLRPTGPRRQQHRVGLQCHGVVDRELIVADHDRIGTQLTEVLHQVVDEAVVTVDDEHTGHRTSMRSTQPEIRSPFCA